jgi:hypothetical protein
MTALSGPSFGSWAKCDICVDDTPAQLVEFSERVSKKDAAVRVAVGGVGVGVGVPDVADAGSAQEGVRQGVQDHVRVRVAVEAAGMLDADAAEDERAAGNEAVRVVAGADAVHAVVLVTPRAAAACRRTR